MASYFGIQDWFRKRTDELSGGQKQLLNLAAVMVMQPKVLIWTSRPASLTPIAASEFLATLQKLNRELGLTVITAEHRLEEVFPDADRVLLMDGGRILLCDAPERIGAALPAGHPMRAGLPSAVRIFSPAYTRPLSADGSGGAGFSGTAFRQSRRYASRTGVPARGNCRG